MAITRDDFKKVWASTSSVPEYTFSDTDYKNGWEFVGNLPPTRAMWDELQRKNDEKMQFLQENGSMCFDSVTDMKSSNLDAGQTAFTKGYYSINDGGDGTYSIRGKVAGETEDGGSVIFLANGNVAELITDETVNVKQFGAKGDGITDDTAPIQNAINYIYARNVNGGVIYLPKGDYKLTDSLVINRKTAPPDDDVYTWRENLPYIKFVGEGYSVTRIYPEMADPIFTQEAPLYPRGMQNFYVHDIGFIGNYICDYVINFDNQTSNYLNVCFDGCFMMWFAEAAIYYDPTFGNGLENNTILTVKDCRITYNKNGIIAGGDDTTIEHSTIQQNEYFGIEVIKRAHHYAIKNCKIQYNGTSASTATDGAQIKIAAEGRGMYIANNYLENRSSSSSLDRNAIASFILYTGDGSENSITRTEDCITNNYANIASGGYFIRRIGLININKISVNYNCCENFKTSYEPALVYDDDTVNVGGFRQGIIGIGNYTTNLGTGGSPVLCNRRYAISTNPAKVDTDYGLWHCGSKTLYGLMPIIISGGIDADGTIGGIKVGTFTVAKTATGTYEITLGTTMDSYSVGAKSKYFVSAESLGNDTRCYVNSRGAQKIVICTEKLVNGSYVLTDLDFTFVAIYLTVNN